MGKLAQKHTIGVADFKARCLELLQSVGARGDEIVVTKRGKPIAQIGPIRPEFPELRGMFPGKIHGDIVNVSLGDWEAAR